MAHDEQDYIDGWQTYSQWLDKLRDESKLIQDYEANDDFQAKLLNFSSNLERFKLIWDNADLKGEIEKFYRKDLVICQKQRTSKFDKSILDSKQMRELGNKSFKNGNYLQALDQYTQAIKFAPYPDQSGTNTKDESLALALANRSAALYALNRYRPCLLDIDLAIKYGYPEPNLFKLLIRKVKCLHVLSVWANDFEQIKDNLRKMLRSRDTKEFVKVEINNMFDFIQQTQPEDIAKDELDVVDETVMKLSNSSKTVSQAADCVEMSCDPEKGRYLLINKDASFGRLLVAEEPFVCNLALSRRDDYCYNCFCRLHSCGIGCRNCTRVLFCSENCLEAKASTHDYECNNFITFQEKLGVAYLVTHIMFKINFDPKDIPVYTRKLVGKKSLEEVLELSANNWPDLVYKNDYTAVLSLMDHAKDYNFDDIMGHAISSVYLTTALVDHFQESNPILNDKNHQTIIGSLVLRHLLQLQTNLISILDQNLQDLVSCGNKISELKELPIGVGIYPTISLLNHSCNPNILSIFHHNKFIARASRTLECGTEINYCYGPSVNRMSKKDRQCRLKEQYFFTCDCTCCSENKEDESRALLCPNSDCLGPIIYNQDNSHECMKCQKSNLIDVKNIQKQVTICLSRFQEITQCDMNHDEKIQKLKELEGKLSRLVYWRNPIFAKIKTELAECAEYMEDLNSAIQYCEEEIELCNKVHGKESYEAIMSKLKLINLKWQCLYYSIEEDKSPKGIEKGVQDLKALLAIASETRGKLKELLTSTNILGAESSFGTELKFLSEIQSSINKYIASLEPQQQAEVVESIESLKVSSPTTSDPK